LFCCFLIILQTNKHSETHVLACLTRERNAKLYKHLMAIDVQDFAIFATSWFMCLYITILPIETALRIWDAFIVEGYKIIYRVGISLLHYMEADLYKATNAGDVLQIILETTRRIYDAQAIMNYAFGIRLFSRSRILQYRKEFREVIQPKKFPFLKSEPKPAEELDLNLDDEDDKSLVKPMSLRNEGGEYLMSPMTPSSGGPASGSPVPALSLSQTPTTPQQQLQDNGYDSEDEPNQLEQGEIKEMLSYFSPRWKSPAQQEHAYSPAATADDNHSGQ